MINIKKNENYNKSCDYRLASVYRGTFCYPVPWTRLPPQSNREREWESEIKYFFYNFLEKYLLNTVRVKQTIYTNY